MKLTPPVSRCQFLTTPPFYSDRAACADRPPRPRAPTALSISCSSKRSIPQLFSPSSLSHLYSQRVSPCHRTVQRCATLVSATSTASTAVLVRFATPPNRRPTRVTSHRTAEAPSHCATWLCPPLRRLNDSCMSPTPSGPDATSARTTPTPRCFPHSSRHPSQAEAEARRCRLPLRAIL